MLRSALCPTGCRLLYIPKRGVETSSDIHDYYRLNDHCSIRICFLRKVSQQSGRRRLPQKSNTINQVHIPMKENTAAPFSNRLSNVTASRRGKPKCYECQYHSHNKRFKQKKERRFEWSQPRVKPQTPPRVSVQYRPFARRQSQDRVSVWLTI